MSVVGGSPANTPLPYTKSEHPDYSGCSFFSFSEWTVAHAAGCSQCGQRRRQRGYRYANHRLPKTVLFHKLKVIIILIACHTLTFRSENSQFSILNLKRCWPEGQTFLNYAPSNPLGSSAPPSLFTNCLVVTSLDWPSLMAMAFRVTDELTVRGSVYSVLLAVGVEPSVV